VAPHQLAEPGREDVVGQVADQHVAAQTAQRHVLDGRDQDLPPQGAEEQVGQDAGHGQSQPGRAGAPQKLGRARQVDFPQDQEETGRADQDSDPAPDEPGAQAAHRIV
jgi:hypothetical protein